MNAKHISILDRMCLTRLERLCVLHNVQGGTIHDFNNMYSLDILSLNETEWNNLVNAIESMARYDLMALKAWLLKN